MMQQTVNLVLIMKEQLVLVIKQMLAKTMLHLCQQDVKNIVVLKDYQDMVHVLLNQIKFVQIIVLVTVLVLMVFVHVQVDMQETIAVKNHALIIVIIEEPVQTEFVHVLVDGLELIAQHKLIYVQQ